MNSCFNGNSGLWILILALILGTNILNSRALTGCGWPFLLALLYCTLKNGTLSQLVDRLGFGNGGNGGCGCNG